MSVLHGDLESRWKDMSLLEQMSNIGSEVDRALNWKAKNNQKFCDKSVDRALELLDFSLDCPSEFPRLKEIARVREALVDYFFCENEYHSTEAQWRRYFLPFTAALRKGY